MKLTNYMRDAFIHSVMNDTPSVDYGEQIRTAAVEAAVAELPQKVAAVWKDKTLRMWVSTSTVHFEGVGSVSLPTWTGSNSIDYRAFAARIREKVKPLCEAEAAQRKARNDLRDKLHRAAYGFTTRKALAAAMPEFAKYLPADDATANRHPPVVTNVVADFVKAGWPKDKGAQK